MWVELQIRKDIYLNASKLVVAFACLFLLIAVAVFFLYGKLMLQVALAEEQIKVFDSMRMTALTLPPQDAAECLEYVQNYYPSGTKQVVGSRLDKIVETAREASSREIITYLQNMTGEEYGDDAKKWKAIDSRN